MTSTRCAYCQGPLNLAREGAKFCSQKCGTYYRRRTFPKLMTVKDRWIRWDHVGGRKMPLKLNGRAASSTNPDTWSTYAEAKASTVGVGLGYVLGDGIGCWDLDDCLHDGKLEPWAREVLDSIPDPLMIEVSQSGNGVHVFVRAEEAKGTVIRDGRNIEFYSKGRYIAVTGLRLGM